MKKKTVKYNDLEFPAIIKPADEGGYFVYCPVLPGCVSEGETYLETLANIEDAIRAYVAVMVKQGDPLPVEAYKPSYSVDIPIRIRSSNALQFA